MRMGTSLRTKLGWWPKDIQEKGIGYEENFAPDLDLNPSRYFLPFLRITTSPTKWILKVFF